MVYPSIQNCFACWSTMQWSKSRRIKEEILLVLIDENAQHFNLNQSNEIRCHRKNLCFWKFILFHFSNDCRTHRRWNCAYRSIDALHFYFFYHSFFQRNRINSDLLCHLRTTNHLDVQRWCLDLCKKTPFADVFDLFRLVFSSHTFQFARIWCEQLHRTCYCSWNVSADRFCRLEERNEVSKTTRIWLNPFVFISLNLWPLFVFKL